MSVTDKNKDLQVVPKNRGNVRRRLQEAAVELFLQKGFDRVTAAEIATRAGVTERTFFRYFPDKRDVLFDEAELHARLDAAVSAAPATLAPLEIVDWAFRSIVPLFEANRPISEPAQTVIARTPALRERQLTKTAAFTVTVGEALSRRGVELDLAGLAAGVGMAIAVHALQTWFEDPSVPLADRFDRGFGALKDLSETVRRSAH